MIAWGAGELRSVNENVAYLQSITRHGIFGREFENEKVNESVRVKERSLLRESVPIPEYGLVMSGLEFRGRRR